MTIRSGAPVVVAVDGSTTALDAVRVAAREAATRGRPLRVVHAFVWPLYDMPLIPVQGPVLDAELREQAEQIVADAMTEAHKTASDLAVTAAVVDGPATPVLLRESRDAALLVLGSRGLGGFAELLMGSVAVQVCARADCPVLVVKGEVRADGPVVVGVDGSDLSAQTLGFAFEEASLRGVELVAVHAWITPTPTMPGDILPLAYGVETLAEDEERVLAESLAGWSQRYPDVPVRHHVAYGAAASVLVRESATAQLTVVGGHGRGTLAGMLLGSVSHAVLHQSHGPLAIVRHHREEGGH
ncbi:universal stress protein [Micromonospora sp. MH99]|uniref:universal stress protein n=1 Tax=Micromonospora sp. MH99 TaxID=1945510 RepID=UPI001F208DE8|nr:universal stress protein [Micromonospora sp. MH99]MCF0096368.1 Universal stress protein [Micromonospora sp. MH99]